MPADTAPDHNLLAETQSAFARLLGPETIEASAEKVEAWLTVRPDLLNRNGMMHGGAIMALADIMGGSGAFANLQPGQGTTTVESKTNFFRAIPPGARVHAVSLPLHRGRRTSVWQTSLYLENGKLAAQVVQTQMVLEPASPAA